MSLPISASWRVVPSPQKLPLPTSHDISTHFRWLEIVQYVYGKVSSSSAQFWDTARRSRIAFELHLAPWKQDLEFQKTRSAVFSLQSCSLKTWLRDQRILRCLCSSVCPWTTFIIVPVDLVAPPTSVALTSGSWSWFRSFRLACNLFRRPSSRPPASTLVPVYRCLSANRVSCMSSKLFRPDDLHGTWVRLKRTEIEDQYKNKSCSVESELDAKCIWRRLRLSIGPWFTFIACRRTRKGPATCVERGSRWNGQRWKINIRTKVAQKCLN